MSSGACRALVAVLLTLVASIVMALPVAANTDRLNESSVVTYAVDPAKGEVDVTIVINLRNNSNRAVNEDTWGPIVVEDRTQPPRPSVSQGFSVESFEQLPGPWRAMMVNIPRIDAGDRVNLRINYTIDASAAQKEEIPARVDSGYLYVCVPGQDTDRGSIILEIKNNARFRTTQSGTELEPTPQGLKSQQVRLPKELFTCVEGTRDDRLATTSFVGPAERSITLQAWPSEEGWLFPAESNSEPALDDIHLFLQHDIPGDGPVVIRQAPLREIGGYASAHDTPAVVQLDENGGVIDPEHELAHAWFSYDNYIELWLREGLATWTATAMRGEACAPVGANSTGLDLSDWQVVRPNANPDTIEQTIADQEAAACGIVRAMADRMSVEQWRTVLGSMLDAETKYIGSSGAARAATTTVDYREFLDAVDERGLVPAAGADADYAANLDDLDFAQNLLADFDIPVDAVELVRRSEARREYHQFLEDAAPLGAPLAVREAMDNWEFQRAMAALDKSREVLSALFEANDKLPTAGLITYIRPSFEGARNEAALDDVLNTTRTLLDSATEVFAPLGELQAAAPEGWGLPAAINGAIVEQRFEDILATISPALRVVQGLVAADAALPSAGLLDQYRVIYEATTSAAGLEELADDVATIRRDAERTGIALGLLRNEVGEWQIPAAVTDPIARGQITAGLAIVNDARAVVGAARDADISLPAAELSSEIRPLFERVTSGPEMAALREEAEARRDEAESVGDALKSLGALVPTWEIPAVVTEPVEAREFTTAAAAASAAQRWVENAWQADQDMAAVAALDPRATIEALDRTRDAFENAESLAALEEGADKAERWAQASDAVANAFAKNNEPRDLLASLGLWGTDVRPALDDALEAAIAADVAEAFNKSAEVIDVLNGASSAGSLRVAGVVFVGIAILGVLGLWVMLRRESGPPWARQQRPHWVDDGGSRWRRGKK